MAKSVLELAVGTGQWDAGLKKAKSALDNFTQANGGLQSALNKDSKSMQTFVQMMGRMDSTAKTAKGQMNDYKGTIEQLTMQYNRLTDAQKQTIGQDYLRSIDQMKQKYQAVADEVAKINQSLKQTQEIGTAVSSGGGLFGSDKLGGMLQVFGGNLMTKAAGMGIGFASELGDMVKQSIELARQGEGIRIAFERLGRGDILDGLRQATHGTVSDIELMKAAVKFNDFRLPLEELGTMLAFAQQKAKDTGQSVDYMVDSIVTGLGRKSLMILDNLGLSAAEIKEKMKDTGDMTKAVGEIIREQMSKAGDYVETAADRATKANVEVQNAMERLGETFQPLTDAGTSMFNSLKVGALDFINKALRPMINMLTEAGRMRKLYNAQKGTNDAKIQEMLEGLSKSELPQHQHRVNLAYWDKNINKYQDYLTDYKTWQNDKSAVGAHDRMVSFQKETGLSFFSDVKEQLEVFKRQKADYVKLSEDLLTKKVGEQISDSNPLPVKVTPTGGGGGTTSVNLSPFVTSEGERAIEHQEFSPMMNTADFMEALRKEMGMDGEMTRDWGKEIGQVFADYIADPDKKKRGKNDKKEEKKDDKVMNSMSKLTSGVTGIFSGIEQMGIEVPEGLKQALNVLNGLTSIATSILVVVETIKGLEAVGLFKLAGGGVVHAAGGYTVPGNLYSGDQVPAMLNSGELVLNRAQQSTLASQLQGQDKQMHVVGEVQGEKIILVANRTFRRKGQGEIVTW